jgi:hypothetical protein
VIITLDTGDRLTVPGVTTDDGYRVAYFELPLRATMKEIAAYGKDGREIAHSGTSTNWVTWSRPDGSDYDTSVPTVRIADGTANGSAWSVDVVEGVNDRCFTTMSSSGTTTMCPDFGGRYYPNYPHGGGSQDGFVLGEVDLKTTRVDVTYKDGTVQHLTPTRSHGHAFVGTYVPEGATVVSVTPVTGTNS